MINWDVNATQLISTVALVGGGLWKLLTKYHAFDKEQALRHQENTDKFERIAESHDNLAGSIDAMDRHMGEKIADVSRAQEKAERDHADIRTKVEELHGGFKKLEGVVEQMQRPR